MVVLPYVILLSSSDVTHSSVKVKHQEKLHKGKKPETQKSSADKLREKIAVEKGAKQKDEMTEWWTAKMAEHAELPSARERAIQTDSLFRNKRAAQGWLALEIRMYRIHLEFLCWIEDPKKESDAANDKYAVSILRKVKDLFKWKTLSRVIVKHTQTVLTVLGFEEYVADSLASLTITEEKAIDRPMTFKFVKLLKSKTGALLYSFMRIRESPTLWQLRLFGEYMDRSMDSRTDKRVAFEPDGWQRKVLDCLDEKKSVLVVGEPSFNASRFPLRANAVSAPTSAGKTFISFYAMEQVLRESDDGILVYVAPTKALVNQVGIAVHSCRL